MADMPDAPPPSPVYGILPNASMVDYPGRMAAVVFLAGCNFRCGFCHNAPLMGRRGAPGMSWTDVETACRRFRDNWVNSVVVTGGEPTLHPGLFPILDKLREWKFSVKLDTNGSRPDILEQALPLVDYVAMDVKFAPDDYPRLAGFSDLDALTRSIALIRDSAPRYEFRTTVIEAWHDEAKIRAIGHWVRGAHLHVLQAFIPRDDLPDPACRSMRQTPSALLHSLADELRHHVRRVEIRGEF